MVLSFPPMFLAPEDIEDFAARYISIPRERTFPVTGDLFARFVREVPLNKVLGDEEGWIFAGYGLCRGYSLNEEAKPRGKSLWWWYLDLADFPPRESTFRLQPPHVVLGRFKLQGGAHEMRVARLSLPPAAGETAETLPAEASSGPEPGTLPFRLAPAGKGPATPPAAAPDPAAPAGSSARMPGTSPAAAPASASLPPPAAPENAPARKKGAKILPFRPK